MMNGHGSDDERLIIRAKAQAAAEQRGVGRALDNIALGIDRVFNPHGPHQRTMGFVLLAFPMGPTVLDQSHKVNVISNADPKDVVLILEEQLQVLREKLAQPAPTQSPGGE